MPQLLVPARKVKSRRGAPRHSVGLSPWGLCLLAPQTPGSYGARAAGSPRGQRYWHNNGYVSLGSELLGGSTQSYSAGETVVFQPHTVPAAHVSVSGAVSPALQ